MRSCFRSATLIALVCLLAITGCGGRAARGSQIHRGEPPGPAISRADVAEDLRVLRAALDEAYAPRAFITDADWETFLARVAELEEDTHLIWFCDALGGTLRSLSNPGLFVIGDERNEGCDSAVRRSFDESRGLAREGAEHFAFRREGAVAVLELRRFVSSGDAGWAGLDAVVAEVAGSRALVVDLRGASGDDPSAVVGLLSQITGREPLRPIASYQRASGATADALRTHPGGPVPIDMRPWQPLIGEETQGTRTYERRIAVIIDEGCELACELVARTLAAYEGAEVIGSPSYRDGMSNLEHGVLTLPRSGLRVSIPTAAFVSSPGVSAATADIGGAWKLRRERDVPAHSPDVEAVIATYQRIASVEATPCGRLPTYSSVEQLPAELAARLEDHAVDGLPRAIVADVDLPPDLAEDYVRQCPGVAWADVIGSDPTRVLVTLGAEGNEPIYRLLSSEVVRRVVVDIEYPTRPAVERAPDHENDRRLPMQARIED